MGPTIRKEASGMTNKWFSEIGYDKGEEECGIRCGVRRDETVAYFIFINFDAKKLKLYRFCWLIFKLRNNVFIICHMNYFKNEESTNLCKRVWNSKMILIYRIFLQFLLISEVKFNRNYCTSLAFRQ